MARSAGAAAFSPAMRATRARSFHQWQRTSSGKALPASDNIASSSAYNHCLASARQALNVVGRTIAAVS